MKQILIGGLIALLLTGCSKLNRENYDKLKMGITYAEASAILGKAERCDDALGTTSCVWGAVRPHLPIRSITNKKNNYNRTYIILN